MNFESTCDITGRTHRYRIASDGRTLSYRDTIDLMQHSPAFRSFFLSLLSASAFAAYRWETPPLTSASVDRPFEFVLIDAPELAQAPDPHTFAAHFRHGEPDSVVIFDNLGGDARLIAPCPAGAGADYSHFGAFVRGAPDTQKHALLQAIGETIDLCSGLRPLWVSTAGDGVAWLHVRLDSRPKYYRHRPYRKTPGS